MIKSRLSLKIIAIVFFLSLIVFSCLSYYQVQKFREEIQDSFIERARSVALSMDASIESIDILQDDQKMFSIMQKHLWLDPDILDIKISIFNDDGSVKTISKYGTATGKVGMTEDQLVSEDHNTLVVITPIHVSGTIKGTSEIDFTLEIVNDKIRSYFRTLMIVYLLMMLMFVVVLFILLNSIIVRPISEINKGMDEITQANLRYDVKIDSKDEFGDLKVSYDQMREYLGAMIRSREESSAGAKSTDKLKNKIKKLEKKIKDMKK